MSTAGKQATALISIYDAANNSDGWNTALDACVDYVQAHSANIMFHENDKNSRWKYALGSARWRACSPEQMARSISMFEKYDSRAWAFVHKHRKQTILTDTDFWTDASELEQREDYKFFRDELGFSRKVGCKLNDNLCWTDNIAFQFPAKLRQIPDNYTSNIRHLLPHAAKSVELWRTFSILKSQYKAVLTALDHVRVGMCIADPNGTIIVANEEANRILDLSADIKLGKDKLIHCRSSEMESVIHRAIHEACATSSGKALAAESFQLLGKAEDIQISLEVSPLRDSNVEIESHFSGALITLIDLSSNPQVDCNKLAAAYKLTTAEKGVCQLLTQGKSARDIAEIRNVVPETVKTQLKSLYRKTRSSNRVDLIRLALKANPPVGTAPSESNRQNS